MSSNLRSDLWYLNAGSDASGRMQWGMKELDVKITSVSGIVEETKVLIMDGVKGTKLRCSRALGLMVHDRKGTTKNHGLVEPYQSSRDTCCYFKKARVWNRRMVPGRRGVQELETRCRNFTLAFWRW